MLKTREHTIAALGVQYSVIIEKHILFSDRVEDGQVYLEVEFADVVKLTAIQILAVINREATPVRMAINICTYHRQESLQKILDVVGNSVFFKKDHALYGKLLIYVVDKR